MQDTVHRLLYIFFIHICRFLCNLLPKSSTLFVPRISGFPTFFSCFTKAGIPNPPFLVALSQFMLFSFVVPQISQETLLHHQMLLLAYTFMLDFYVFRNNRNQKSSFVITALFCKQDFFSPHAVCLFPIYLHPWDFAGIQSSGQNSDLIHIQSES